MLSQLYLAEQELPYLLTRPEIWQSLFINYEKPYVERLWCNWKEYRLNLHRISPCEESESFFHPHPWPSAMKIVKGIYRMSVGHGSGLIAPPVAWTFNLSANSAYEMIDLDSWHSVQPIGGPVWSIMLTGKPWGRLMPKSDNIRLTSLSEYKTQEMFSFFQEQYIL